MRAEGDPPLARPNEIQHFRDFRSKPARPLQTLHRQFQVPAHSEQRHERATKGIDRGRRVTGPAQTDRVDGAKRVISIHDAEWRDVAAHAASAAGKRQPSDAGELMHDAVARDESTVADLYPSGKQGATANDDVVADPAIVRDVCILHHEIVVADDRDVALLASAMHGRTFAEDIAIADPDAPRHSAVFQVLRFVADNGGRVDNVVGSDLGVAQHRDVANQTGARADADSSVKQAEGTDFDSGSEFDLGTNDRGRMDARGCGLGRHRNSPRLSAEAWAFSDRQDVPCRPPCRPRRGTRRLPSFPDRQGGSARNKTGGTDCWVKDPPAPCKSDSSS